MSSLQLSVRALMRTASVCAVAAALTISAAVHSAPGDAPAGTTLSYLRLYAGPDGMSHFASQKLVLASAPGAPGLQGMMPVNIVGDAKGVTFARLAAGATEDWHVAPQRMVLVCVQGTVEVTAGDGQKRRLTPGQFILLEDTSGKGHITHVPGTTDHVALAMTPPAGWPGT